MKNDNQSLAKTWMQRLPERAHKKGYTGRLGNALFLLKYIRIKIIDNVARHCPVTSLRETLYGFMGVKIGRGTFIGRDVYFDTAWPELISIGEGCSIAQCSILLCHEYDLENYFYGDLIHNLPHIIKPISIGRNVMIGSRSTILPGVSIGEGAVIATGAIVNRDIPAWSIAAGAPARVVRKVVNHPKNKQE